MITPTFKVETGRLRAAIKERLRYPGRTEAEAVNTSAFYIAVNTKNAMPAASIRKIDTDLDKFVVPIFRVKGLAGPTKRTKVKFGKGTARQDAPLIALIINSRVGKSGRWGLSASPFKGVSRAAGRAAMQRMAQKLLKARHSSTNFLRSGWIGAIRDLYSSAKRRAGGSPLEGSNFDYDFDKRGSALPAKEGSWNVVASAENNTGAIGQSAAEANDALHRYGDIILQREVDAEYGRTVDYLVKKYAESGEKFNEMCK
jgi:hypothetical protein